MRRLALLLLCVLLFACGASVAPAGEAQPEPTPIEVPVEEVLIAQATPAATDAPVWTEAPTDTPAPTEAPTPEPTPEPERIDEQRLASGEFDSYFDDAVFVGDSITHSFKNYVTEQRASKGYCLGDAKFLGVINMSALRAAQNKVSTDGIDFRFRGKALSYSDAIRETGAKKVFLLLGVNELEWCRWDDETKAFRKLIELTRAVDPDIEIVIHAVLPITERYCKRNMLDIEKWNSFNDVLKTLCEENGVMFLSFAEQLMDENGYLDEAFSSDRQYHLNGDGADIWIRTLRAYAARQTHPDAVIETGEGD